MPDLKSIAREVEDKIENFYIGENNRYVLPRQLENLGDYLWINFKSKRIVEQSAYARGQGALNTSDNGEKEWRFLAPESIQETVAHDWGEYENIGTRLTQKIHNIQKGIFEAGELKEATFSNLARSLKNKGGISANDVINAATGIDVQKTKYDASLVYQDSKRREYSLTFNISWAPGIRSFIENKIEDVLVSGFGLGGIPQYERARLIKSSINYSKLLQAYIVDPIRKLEEYSCAEMLDSFTNIDFPYIFTVYSYPKGLIRINNAAITSVQPTWNGPYVYGIPTNCELQITFMDIEPLYRRSIRQGGLYKSNIIRTEGE